MTNCISIDIFLFKSLFLFHCLFLPQCGQATLETTKNSCKIDVVFELQVECKNRRLAKSLQNVLLQVPKLLQKRSKTAFISTDPGCVLGC